LNLRLTDRTKSDKRITAEFYRLLKRRKRRAAARGL